jgi:hypothetical protein
MTQIGWQTLASSIYKLSQRLAGSGREVLELAMLQVGSADFPAKTMRL